MLKSIYPAWPTLVLLIKQLSLSHPTASDSPQPHNRFRLRLLLRPRPPNLINSLFTPISNGSNRYFAHYRYFDLGSDCHTCCPRRAPLRQGQRRYQCREDRSGHVPLASYQEVYGYVPRSLARLLLTFQLRKSSDLHFPMTRTLLLGEYISYPSRQTCLTKQTPILGPCEQPSRWQRPRCHLHAWSRQ